MFNCCEACLDTKFSHQRPELIGQTTTHALALHAYKAITLCHFEDFQVRILLELYPILSLPRDLSRDTRSPYTSIYVLFNRCSQDPPLQGRLPKLLPLSGFMLARVNVPTIIKIRSNNVTVSWCYYSPCRNKKGQRQNKTRHRDGGSERHVIIFRTQERLRYVVRLVIDIRLWHPAHELFVSRN